MSNGTNKKKAEPGQEIATIQQANSPRSVSITNPEAKGKIVRLPDGSEVTLSPYSKINYEIDSTQTSRTIKLEGDAFFKVAKDSRRPFTVYSGDLSTTALGTEFYVSSQKEPGNIDVSLYEGKVMIKTNLKKPTATKTYYLMPGNKLIYDSNSLVTRIIDFKNDHGRVIHGGKKQPQLVQFQQRRSRDHI